MAIHAIVGLGNPGRRYARTRHNVGFMVADRLAGRFRLPWKASIKGRLQLARGNTGGRPLLLVKPQTFMNESGLAVAWLVRKYRVLPEELLVVYDDVALALGRVRLRASGGHGGHNGMRSIIEHVGTNDFPRLRVGIAGPCARPGADLADYVLSTFAPEELSVVEPTVAAAADAAAAWLAHGIDAAMNRFNTAQDDN